MRNSAKTAGPKTRLPLGLVAVPVAGLLLLAGTVATQAFTPNVARTVDHFVECFGWMITDPRVHEAECGPGSFPPYESISSSTDSVPPIVTTTTTISLPTTTTITITGPTTTTTTTTTPD